MLLEENNSIEANYFIINYYINMFREEHLRISLNNKILREPTYPKLFGHYDGKYLLVSMSKDNRIKVGSNITHINKEPFLKYLKKFTNFNKGFDTEVSDLIINSYILFLNYNNPFVPAPKNITIDNTIIDLKYINCPAEYLDIYKYSDVILNELKIYKDNEKNILYIVLPTFDFDDTSNDDKYKNFFNYIKKLLPVKKIIIDLTNNFGGDVKNVENFFNVVYNLKINWGVYIKNSNFINENENNNIIKYKTIRLNKCIGPSIDKKINNPKLEIIVNEYSKSACRTFCQIAKIYLNNVKIKGKINLYPICGSEIIVCSQSYTLCVPSMCYPCPELVKNKYFI
jgi:hypothetical protein